MSFDSVSVSFPLHHSFFLADALGPVPSLVPTQTSISDHQKLHHRHGTLSSPHSAVLEEVKVSAAAGRVVSPHQEIRLGGSMSGVPVLRICSGVDAQLLT